MPKATITISFEQEKLKALQFYAGKKGADLQGEMDDVMQKLYEKYVPVSTREYIESQVAPPRSQPTRPSRISSSPAPTPISHARTQGQDAAE